MEIKSYGMIYLIGNPTFPGTIHELAKEHAYLRRRQSIDNYNENDSSDDDDDDDNDYDKQTKNRGLNSIITIFFGTKSSFYSRQDVRDEWLPLFSYNQEVYDNTSLMNNNNKKKNRNRENKTNQQRQKKVQETKNKFKQNALLENIQILPNEMTENFTDIVLLEFIDKGGITDLMKILYEQKIIDGIKRKEEEEEEEKEEEDFNKKNSNVVIIWNLLTWLRKQGTEMEHDDHEHENENEDIDKKSLQRNDIETGGHLWNAQTLETTFSLIESSPLAQQCTIVLADDISYRLGTPETESLGIEEDESLIQYIDVLPTDTSSSMSFLGGGGGRGGNRDGINTMAFGSIIEEWFIFDKKIRLSERH